VLEVCALVFGKFLQCLWFVFAIFGVFTIFFWPSILGKQRCKCFGEFGFVLFFGRFFFCSWQCRRQGGKQSEKREGCNQLEMSSTLSNLLFGVVIGIDVLGVRRLGQKLLEVKKVEKM